MAREVSSPLSARERTLGCVTSPTRPEVCSLLTQRKALRLTELDKIVGPLGRGRLTSKLACAQMGIADLHLPILQPVVTVVKLAVNEALSGED